MKSKTFNVALGLLATSLGIEPEVIIDWFQEMSRHFTSVHGSVAEYASMALAPFMPQIYFLADNRRKTIVVGGHGADPKTKNFKVEFAPELTTIGKWFQAFREYVGEELVVPQSVIAIEDGAFEFMDFKQLIIGARILELPLCICCGCDELTSVRLPETIVTIGHSAFRFCGKLSNINIPDSVHTIGKLAFQGCNCLPDETRAKILQIGGPEAFEEVKEARDS